MQVCVRPMEANLTHDTELFGRMVTPTSYSPPTAKSISEDSTNAHSHVSLEERIPTGMIPSTSLFHSARTP